MATNNIGDRLVSFGGYTFIPDLTLGMDYPFAVRNQLRTIPGADYQFNPFGGTPAPVEATDVTFDYWLAETTGGAFFTTNTQLKAELAAIKDAMHSVGSGTLVTMERDGTTTYSATCVFKSMDPKIVAENLINMPLTLVFTPLTRFS